MVVSAILVILPGGLGLFFPIFSLSCHFCCVSAMAAAVGPSRILQAQIFL